MKIDDLPDTVFVSATNAPEDPRTTEWYLFLQEIDEALINYSWAADTLDGIRETVEKTQRVSEGQRRAVTNICRARGRGQNVSRRYEGFRRDR